MTQHKRTALLAAGQVQGVGFRPVIYRLAVEGGLSGSVGKTSAKDMIAAVRDGRDPEVMPAEALKSVRIVHAVYESARTGKTVML